MYLTDFREVCLQDVITKLEPGLFKKVTGLYVKDFELLCSLGLFNEDVWNDAIFKFRRYEEASLDYTGINKHEGESVGGWSTVLSVDDYNALYKKQADEEPVLMKTEISYKPEVQTKMNKRLEKPIKTPNLNKHTTVHYEQKPQPVSAAAEKPKAVLIKKSSEMHVTIAPNAGYDKENSPQKVFEINKIVVGAKVKNSSYRAGTITFVSPSKNRITVTFGYIRNTYSVPEAFLNNELKLIK